MARFSWDSKDGGRNNAYGDYFKGGKVMNSGICYVIFRSHNGIFGDGLAIVDNGKIHGGDNCYLYRGHYKEDGNALRATIQVSYYLGKFGSLFGPVDKYGLILAGDAAEDKFKMNRHIFGRSQMQITIEGQKQADLVTQFFSPLHPDLHPYHCPGKDQKPRLMNPCFYCPSSSL